MTFKREDPYGYIETRWETDPKSYETDPFESMLSLCRMLGLEYTIKESEDGKFLRIKVRMYSSPLQFYAPTDEPVSASILTNNFEKDHIVFQLKAAISGVFMEIVRNCNAFGYSFIRDWKEKTGSDWNSKGMA